MGSQRPLIVPWLLEQLNTQQYPGVSWLNPEKTQFRVPWKHKSRHSFSQEDYQLFEAWAIASGHYNPHSDPKNPSVWKRNFRSALNRKEDIGVIKDNSTDADDPHKVFEIRRGAAAAGDGSPRAAQERVSEPFNLVGSSGACGYSFPPGQDHALESGMKSLDLASVEEILESETTACCGTVALSELDLAPVTAVTTSPLEIFGNRGFDTDFDVRVYYRGRLVFSNVFSNVQGLCFLPPGSSGPYPDLADVVLPDPATLNDRKQALYTNRILEKLAPGVLLHTEGESLCGTRLGRCHVYWSLSETPGEPCGELPKTEFGCVYHLQKFVQDLIAFMEGRRGSPEYSLWLCFGESWPDAQLPWKKKLIMVEVVPKALELIHEWSKCGGASSLTGQEPDLRISDSLQDSNKLEILKEWEEKMEVEGWNTSATSKLDSIFFSKEF